MVRMFLMVAGSVGLECLTIGLSLQAGLLQERTVQHPADLELHVADLFHLAQDALAENGNVSAAMMEMKQTLTIIQ